MWLWLYIATAGAQDIEARTYFGKSLGWSPDGRYVAVEMVTDQFSHYHHYGLWRSVIAWDTWTGERREFQGEVTLNPEPPDNDEPTTVAAPSEWSALPPMDGLTAFTGALTATDAATCGDANLRARLVASVSQDGVSRVEEKPNAVALYVRGGQGVMHVTSPSGGVDWPAFEHQESGPDDYMATFWSGADWEWRYSPTCGRAVLISHLAGFEGSRDGYAPDGATATVSIIDLGPRVDVMAHADHQSLVLPAATALSTAGWAVRLAPAAKARRSATVVYAWSRAKASADALLVKLPGGGTVDKLTWKTPADIVVALGAP